MIVMLLLVSIQCTVVLVRYRDSGRGPLRLMTSICGASESLCLVASVVRGAWGITSFLLVTVFESMLCIFSS